jgi:ketosteroid isomerase-like protein
MSDARKPGSSTMSADNKQKAVDYLVSGISGDRAKMETLVADDMKMWMPQSAGKLVSGPNPVVGGKAILDLVDNSRKNLWDHSGGGKRIIEHVAGDGDIVAVHCRLVTKIRSGAAYDNDYVFLFRFENGKIAELWEFTDTAHAYSVFAPKS